MPSVQIKWVFCLTLFRPGNPFMHLPRWTYASHISIQLWCENTSFTWRVWETAEWHNSQVAGIKSLHKYFFICFGGASIYSNWNFMWNDFALGGMATTYTFQLDRITCWDTFISGRHVHTVSAFMIRHNVQCDFVGEHTKPHSKQKSNL